MAKILKRTVMTSNTDEAAEKLDHSHIVRGDIKQYSHSEKQLAVFYKLNTCLKCSPRSSNCTLGICPRENETYAHTKNIFLDVYSSVTCQSLKLETTQMSFKSEWSKDLGNICPIGH